MNHRLPSAQLHVLAVLFEGFAEESSFTARWSDGRAFVASKTSRSLVAKGLAERLQTMTGWVVGITDEGRVAWAASRSLEFEVKWFVEGVADDVCGIACTWFEEHPADRAVRFTRQSLLHFEVTGDRHFLASIDGMGPRVSAWVDAKFERATVLREGCAPRRVKAYSHDVAMAVMGLRPDEDGRVTEEPSCAACEILTTCSRHSSTRR